MAKYQVSNCRMNKGVMMTKMKKLLSFMMAALMCVALTPMAAFAANGTNNNDGTITLENAIPDKTYSVYEILQLESYNTDTNAYSYIPVEAWSAFLADQDFLVIDRGYVTLNPIYEGNDEAAAAFARSAVAYAKDDNHRIDPTAEAVSDSDGNVAFTGLNLGYYVLDSSVGTLCSLVTTATDAAIQEKNDAPTVEKQVLENSTGEYGKENDVALGDKIEFKAVITGQPGAQNYVYHDIMTEGLILDPASIAVEYKGSVLATDNYTVALNVKHEDPESTIWYKNSTCTFEVAFNQTFLDNISANDEITISYEATLDVALVESGTNDFDNICYLNYGDNHETVLDATTTHTWDLYITKYTGDADNPIALADAIFTLEMQTKDQDGNDVNVTIFEEIASDEFGRINQYGLDSGTYTLTEVQAPDGYNKLAGPLTVIIGNQGEVSVINANGEAASAVGNEILVENKTGSLLPSTGGIGTTILYVIGGILIVGAIVYLVRRRSNTSK